jgi:hypothetical protein
MLSVEARITGFVIGSALIAVAVGMLGGHHGDGDLAGAREKLPANTA